MASALPWFKRPLPIAVAVFLAAKLLFAWLPVAGLGTPRIGDDSLSYLWKASQVLSGYPFAKPALEDFLAHQALDDGIKDESVLFWRGRIVHRTLGSQSPPYDAMNALLLATGMPTKYAFAVSETIVGLVLAAGLAVFLTALFGETAAATGLVVLSFILLPSHGLHYLIADTLALAGALFMWAHVIRAGPEVRVIPMLIGAAVVLMIHPVARLYLVVAGLVHLAMLGSPRNWFARRTVVLGAGMFALLVANVALHKVWPAYGLEIARDGRAWDFGAGFVLNAKALGRNLIETVKAAPLVPVLLLIGLLTPKGRAMWTRPVLALAGSGLLLMGAMLFYWYPRFPAEVSVRAFIFVYVVLAGLGAAALAPYLAGGRPMKQRIAAGLMLAACVISALPQWRAALADNLNARTHVVDEPLFARRLAAVPAGGLLYLEPDSTLYYALLAGADARRAIVVHTINGSPLAEKIVESVRPPAALGPLPGLLNPKAYADSTDLLDRRAGISLALTTRLAFNAGAAALPPTWLRVRNPSGRSVALTAWDNPTSLNPTGAPSSITVPAGHGGWLRVDPTASRVSRLVLALPQIDGAWIEGIAFGAPKDGVNWPWNSGIQIVMVAPKIRDGRPLVLPFEMPSYFRSLGMPELAPLVPRERPVLSDDSGIVILRTIFAQP